MTRHLLELCLLAYPRASRERDREYLRDLALELAESDGFGRQAASLVLGGLKDRFAARRRGRAAVGAWAKRALAACLVLGAVAIAANAVTGMPGGRTSREVEKYACADVGDRPARGECADARALAAARERDGWDCATRGRTSADRREVAWECSRASSAFSWLSL
jgi:hypothetical protein